MENQTKPLVILIGKSGTGKTSVAEYLCDTYGWTQIESYTTRPRRSIDEIGHHFITEAEFDQIPMTDRIAYMEYCGHRYCSRRAQLDNADLYVVTPDGYEAIQRQYHNRPLFAIALTASTDVLKNRMKIRGGSTEEEIEKRIQRDDSIFQNLKTDITISTENLSIPEVGDTVMALFKLRLRQINARSDFLTPHVVGIKWRVSDGEFEISEEKRKRLGLPEEVTIPNVFRTSVYLKDDQIDWRTLGDAIMNWLSEKYITDYLTEKYDLTIVSFCIEFAEKIKVKGEKL